MAARACHKMGTGLVTVASWLDSFQPLMAHLPCETMAVPLQLNGLSPMIWRRLLISEASSLADLHHVLQIVFGWDDSHLNRFHIHARDFCLYREGGIWADDAHQSRLSDFSFRLNEKFYYEYDLNVPWKHVIRVEKIQSSKGEVHPQCLSGQGQAPPEDCGGHEGFRTLQKNNSLIKVLSRSADMIKRFLDDRELPSREEGLYLKRWLKPRKIDRRQINHCLRLYASGN